MEIIPGIKILETIGDGATSIVYRVVATKDLKYASRGSILAAKLYRHPLSSKKMGRRFSREVKIGKSIKSDYLAKYYDSGFYRTELEKRPFIIMEYVKGKRLANFFQNLSSLSGKERHEVVLTILTKLIMLLSTLQEFGVVHRDIHPGNILIRDHNPILLDLGLAKHLRQNDTITYPWEEIGTRRYWAPECTRTTRQRWSSRTDLFMVASVFVHLITGKRIFSEARNYPTFYQQLMQLDTNHTQIPELDRLPQWVWLKVGKLLYIMLAPEKARPTPKQLLALVNGEEIRLPSPTPNNAYPLGEFLWHVARPRWCKIWPTVELLAQLYRNDGRNSRLTVSQIEECGNCGPKGTVENIQDLLYWGLMKPMQPTVPYAISSNDSFDLLPDASFRPCQAAIRVVELANLNDKLKKRYFYWHGAFWHAGWRASGPQFWYRHCDRFDHITYKNSHFLTKACCCKERSEALRAVIDGKYKHENLAIPGLVWNDYLTRDLHIYK